jgi:hypothetical protein
LPSINDTKPVKYEDPGFSVLEPARSACFLFGKERGAT